ncbi:MAG TPA: helix-turn-helix domain-containing protein [Rhizobiaceae bacterium]|nr:helix-turn-helix domain-containing protein [Rhizobiaceae bacterium]
MAICDGVIDIMAAIFNVPGKELRESGRPTREIGRIRQIGMYAANTALGLSMAAVARGFGKDRSTVVHACHLIEDMRDDASFDALIGKVERIVVTAFTLNRRMIR